MATKKRKSVRNPQLLRNPVAMDLRTPKYRKRVTKDRTKYDRKRVPKVVLVGAEC